ncbi:MAG: hypothetical protein JO345_36685 [Streptosporangiaceae bacterium]|nr:hypothetical protein [Streptosporangiaceae bacterium]
MTEQRFDLVVRNCTIVTPGHREQAGMGITGGRPYRLRWNALVGLANYAYRHIADVEARHLAENRSSAEEKAPESDPFVSTRPQSSALPSDARSI